MTQKTVPEDHTIVQVQSGALRFIGSVEQGAYLSGKIELHNAGVTVVARGQRPGAIAGSVENVKIIQIVPLDYATGPITIQINNVDFLIQEKDMDAEGATFLRDEYVQFINSAPSAVSYTRIDNRLP
jgi:hypothetical protein